MQSSWVSVWIFICIIFNSGIFSDEKDEILRASFNGNIHILEIFYKYNLNLNFQENKSGITPLHLAVMSGKSETVEYLLAKKVELNTRDTKFEYTPLHLAVYKGYLDIAKKLLDNGADIEAKSKDKNTPLIIAASRGNLDMVKFLLSKGASLETKNEKGKTAFDRSRGLAKDYILKFIKLKEESNSSCNEILSEFYDAFLIDEDIDPLVRGKIFQEIYRSESNKPNFKECVYQYLDKDSRKFYWTGVFLFDEDYTSIKNYELAEEILKKGFEVGTHKAFNVSICFMIGVLKFKSGKKKQARYWIDRALKLSEKYPGMIPALPYEGLEIQDFFYNEK